MRRSAALFALFCSLAVALLLSGCMMPAGQLSLAAGSSVLNYQGIQSAPVAQGVQAESDGRWWFLFIPLGPSPSFPEAVQRCLDKGRGDFVSRCRFYSTGWSALIVSYGSITVIGDVGNSRVVSRPGGPAVIIEQK